MNNSNALKIDEASSIKQGGNEVLDAPTLEMEGVWKTKDKRH